MKLQATRSPKLKRLMRIADMRRVEAVGTLELLWLFAMEQAPSADVGRWSDMDLETELDWSGEPGALIAALVESGWLDRCLEHRLVIHDWADHLPEFLKKRVDRGSLAVYSATPCPDSVGQCPDMSGNVPIREGKGREGKPREGKGSQQKETASRRTATVRRVCPESLSEEQKAKMLAWAKDQNFTRAQLTYGWQRLRDWSQGKGEKRTDWLAVFRNGLRDGWVLEGFGRAENPELKPKGLAYAEWTGHGEKEAM